VQISSTYGGYGLLSPRIKRSLTRMPTVLSLLLDLEMAFLYALVVILGVVVATFARRRRGLSLTDKVQPRLGASWRGGSGNIDENNKASESASTIEPLTEFDWEVTPPLKLRPFKPTYNITMSVFHFIVYPSCLNHQTEARANSKRYIAQLSNPAAPPSSSSWTATTSPVSGHAAGS
jgi:hypothetical protein